MTHPQPMEQSATSTSTPPATTSSVQRPDQDGLHLESTLLAQLVQLEPTELTVLLELTAQREQPEQLAQREQPEQLAQLELMAQREQPEQLAQLELMAQLAQLELMARDNHHLVRVG